MGRRWFGLVYVLISTCFIFFAGVEQVRAQSDQLRLKFSICNEVSAGYRPGDSLHLQLEACQLGVGCSSGLSKVRLFSRGVRLLKVGDWIPGGNNRWVKEVEAVVTGNKKNLWQITAYRKTDQDELVNTLTIKNKFQ